MSDPGAASPILKIQAYWDTHIHDIEITTTPIGSTRFYQELDRYRYAKLDYLPDIINFSRFKGEHLLEVGCGIGTDLARFAQAGARVTGIDASVVALNLARQNIEGLGLVGQFCLMDGERLGFEANRFDAVYAHGVLQYTVDPEKMIAEIHRVLRPDGEAILMTYNKRSWLNVMSKLTQVPLEHKSAPYFHTHTIAEFRQLLARFKKFQIIPERFPVETRLHRGLKAFLYNRIFIKFFNLLPRGLVQPLGWHLMAFARK